MTENDRADLRRKAWFYYTGTEYERTMDYLKKLLELEEVDSIGHERTLYYLANTHFRLGAHSRGLDTLVESLKISWNRVRRQARDELHAFGLVQNSLAYQQIVGTLTISPHDLLKILTEEISIDTSHLDEEQLTQLVLSDINLETNLLEGNLDAVSNEIDNLLNAYNEKDRSIYLGRIFLYQSKLDLAAASSETEIREAIKWGYLSFFEDLRFALRDSDVLNSYAATLLQNMFSIPKDQLWSTGWLVLSHLEDRITNSEYDQNSPFMRCAYLKGNPSEQYEELLKLDVIEDRITQSLGVGTAPTGLREERILGKIKKVVEIPDILRQNKNQFNEYLLRERKVDSEQNQLIILRRWNSITPRNPEEKSGGEGGGFLLIWNGKGIAVDPGYDFLQNLAECNYSINDIDLIIATHAHDDHTAEIEPIFSLDYKAESLRQDIVERMNQFQSGLLERSLNEELTDFVDDPEYYLEKPGLLQPMRDEKGIPFCGSEGTHIKFMNMLTNTWCVSVTLGTKKDSARINRLLKPFEISIDWNYARHLEQPWMQKPTSISFILKMLNQDEEICGIGFTGDTVYNNEDQNHADSLAELFSKADILVANVGSYREPSRNHLTEIGITKLLRRITPQIVLVTEFGKETESIRDIIAHDIALKLQTTPQNTPFGGPPSIFPVDTGFRVHLEIPDYKISTFHMPIPVPYNQVAFYDPPVDDELGPQRIEYWHVR